MQDGMKMGSGKAVIRGETGGRMQGNGNMEKQE